MIILDRNITAPQGSFVGGDDVSHLPKEVTDDLLARGWAHEVHEEQEAPAGGSETDERLAELKQMKVDDLKEIAGGLDIEGFDQMKKDQLVAAIAEVQSDSEGGDPE